MTPDRDVVVVGGGFTGLTAARELSQRGRSVLLVEARNRIGGRTWADRRLGRDRLEMGGAWIHWLQPHVWSEVRRYGIELEPAGFPETGVWFESGERREGPSMEAFSKLLAGSEAFGTEARERFPDPYRPLSSPAAEEIDGVSLAERLATLDVPAEQRDLLEAAWVMSCNGYAENAGYSAVLRWVAVCGGSPALFYEACGGYEFEGGTTSLANAIAADSAAELTLERPVRAIGQNGDRVVVSLETGEEVTARAAVVTLPLNALRDFDVELSDAKRKALAIGQASSGAKVWMRVKGERSVIAWGHADWPFGFVGTEYLEDGDSIMFGLSRDAKAHDFGNRDVVQEALHKILPEAELLDTSFHDWVNDPYTRQTWGVSAPGALAARPALDAPDGRVILAGSDYANGWNGFIDGAIESGMSAATKVDGVLNG